MADVFPNREMRVSDSTRKVKMSMGRKNAIRVAGPEKCGARGRAPDGRRGRRRYVRWVGL